MYGNLGGISQLLNMMLQLKQLEQLTSALNNASRGSAVTAAGGAKPGSTEDDAVAREKLRLQALGESYKAYGEYCKLLGLEPSAEGYESWYAQNGPGGEA